MFSLLRGQLDTPLLKADFGSSRMMTKSPKWRTCWISILLLLILLQMLTCLQFFSGVFVSSDEVLIGPLFFCQTFQNGQQSCIGWSRIDFSGSVSGMNTLQRLVVWCFYVPVVLVPFSLLAMLFAAYSKDRTAVWCSLALQVASSLLTLAGIFLFVVLYQSYFSLKDVTVLFYGCVGIQVELVVTSALSYVSGRKLSDWELNVPASAKPQDPERVITICID